MARVMRNFDFPKTRRMKYGWNDWFDGQPWQLVRGEDFAVETRQMRKNVYEAAWTRGIRVRTSLSGGNLIVQAFRPKDQKDAGKGAA